MDIRLKFALAAVFISQWVYAAPVTNLEIADIPLLNAVGVDPNIMFVIDDSGSMAYEVLGNDFENAGAFEGPLYAFPLAPDIYRANINPDAITVPDFDDNNPLNTALRNSDINPAFYDPAVTYLPWVNADGSLMPASNPARAQHQPFDNRFRNLTIDNGTAGDASDSDPNSDHYARALFIAANGQVNGGTISLGSNNQADFEANAEVIRFYPATYYRTNPNGGFTRVEIRDDGTDYRGGSGRTDCGDDPLSCTYAQEIQNFANWYTYHRARTLIARSGAGRAFVEQDENRRVGFDRINNFGGVQPQLPIHPGTFSGQNKAGFFNALYTHALSSTTPLRQSLMKIGEYYRNPSNNGPWGPAEEIPGEGNQQLSCRQSYTIMMTDGFRNEPASYNPGVGNADNTATSTRTGPGPDSISGTEDDTSFAYNPTTDENLIFSDPHSNTMADIAFDYWSRDLRDNLDDNVPTNIQDPAFWQHMTTFTVGFGTSGTLAFPNDLSGLSADNPEWPAPENNSPTSVDDLWHTGINGHGGYFNAADSMAFVDSLSNALSGISGRSQASGTSVSFSSGAVQTGTQIYQATYTGGIWIGDVQAFDISNGSGNGQCDDSQPFGTVCMPEAWSAAQQLANTSANSRTLLTYNPLSAEGIPFRYSDLNPAQQAAFIAPNDTGSPAELTSLAMSRVDYLRGDDSNEQTEDGVEGLFRFRENLLGDIVNSSPLFVGAPSRRYPNTFIDVLGGPTPENGYSSFVESLSDRTAVVYAGANDGFLHGFNAGRINSANGNFESGDGSELLGYMPAKILPNTVQLTDPEYFHRFFVDGPLAENDVFFAGRWHSVLVGTMGAGGQGLFALEITNPTDFGEQGNRPDNTVLWEFADTGTEANSDADIGFILSRPSIVRLHNGRWAVITSNGYNNTEQDNSVSTTGNAMLFVIDIETGEIIRKIDTQQGFANDPVNGVNRPNGLGAVTPVDVDGDLITDYVYAGDLFGNVWRFDLLSTNEAEWEVSNFGSGAPEPLFTAMDNDENAQPITSAVQVAAHPNGIDYGVVVYFGSGKYFELADTNPDSNVTQSFYAIYDTSLASPEVLASSASSIRPRPANGIERSDLLEQRFDAEALADGELFRRVTDNVIDFGEQLGWYLDLQVGDDTSGERAITGALVRGNDLLFTTFTPSADPCEPGGDGFLVVLDRVSGSRTEQSPFNVDNDEFNRINADDLVDFGGTQSEVASAIRITGGGTTPTLLVGKGSDIALIADYQGNIKTLIPNLSAHVSGRETWRQLR